MVSYNINDFPTIYDTTVPNGQPFLMFNKWTDGHFWYSNLAEFENWGWELYLKKVCLKFYKAICEPASYILICILHIYFFAFNIFYDISRSKALCIFWNIFWYKDSWYLKDVCHKFYKIICKPAISMIY